jgi:GT2 family glycosyltransferase
MLHAIGVRGDGLGFGAAVTDALDDPEAGLLAMLPREDAAIPRSRLERLLAGGLRIGAVVPRIAWTVQEPGPPSAPVSPGSYEGPPLQEVLVVAASLDCSSIHGRDLWVRSLIADLAGLLGEASVTVAALDGFRCSDLALRRRGISVQCGPRDWPEWFGSQWGRFSHVFVGRDALMTPFDSWLRASQPQAFQVLALDQLPSRRIESLRPHTPLDEIDGLDFLAGVVDGRLLERIAGSQGVICAAEGDAARIAATNPGLPVAHLAPPVASAAQADAQAFGDRNGIALIAADGADVVAGNEDAAFRAITEVIDPIRTRWPSLRVSVVTDSPTPLLVQWMAERGLEIWPTAACHEVLAGSRLALALHPAGTGGADTILACLRARTPFIATAVAATGLDLGGLHERCVFDDPHDAQVAAGQLLRDETTWLGAQAALDDLISRCSRRDRTESLRGLLLDVGLDARARPARWPDEPPPNCGARGRCNPPPPLRPAGATSRMADPFHGASGPRDEAERYRQWQERYGPTGQALDDFRREVAQLNHQPLISVVMPVYDPDPDTLLASIRSLRDQVYDRWELCIADDGSARPGTAEVLDRLAQDPSVRLARPVRPRGAAATANAALELAEGEFVAFMDHDALLKPHALAQVARWLDSDPAIDFLYTDEDKIDHQGRLQGPHLKPGWSPDLLMSMNYIGHLSVARRSLVKTVGGLRPDYEGSEDYDLLLRMTEQTPRIAHIPEPLYTARAGAKPPSATSAKRALADALTRRGVAGSIEDTPIPAVFRTRYAIPGQPRAAIIIPTKDAIELLRPCIESIFELSTYGNSEIVVVDNDSRDGATLEFLEHAPVKVVRYPHRFNYARQMNLAAASVEADVLVFLNNDTKVITPDWLEALLEHAMRPEVGAVGGRLFYASGRVQHEGILVGAAGRWAWNVDHHGYFMRGDVVRNVSAVTGACTAMRSTVYARLGGNDERLRVTYNDVDICLRARQAGYEVVYTPYAELFHYEGATRAGREHEGDGPLFGRRWRALELVDPYHSPLFTRDCLDDGFLLAL